MKVYKFKCKDCGATKYNKSGNTYKCQYCGYSEEVYGDQAEELKPYITPQASSVMPTSVSETRNSTSQENSVGSLLVKLMLCFFAGYLGVHKFMERKIILGILYLFTFGLFGIGYFIDCAIYFFKLIGALINYKKN